MTTRPVRRLIGERGREAVLPLHRLKEMVGGGGGFTFNLGGIHGGDDFLRLPRSEKARILGSLLADAMDDDPELRRYLSTRLRGTL